MTIVKSLSNEVKRVASDAQAAGAEFTSAVADDVQQFAKEVGKSGAKTSEALQDDINDLRKEVSRVMTSLQKIAGQASDQTMTMARDRVDELTVDATKAGAAVKKSAMNAASDMEVAISKNPLTSIAVSLGLGFALGQLMRR